VRITVSAAHILRPPRHLRIPGPVLSPRRPPPALAHQGA